MKRAIALAITLLFFFNSISFALSPQAAQDRPDVQDAMQALGNKYFLESFPAPISPVHFSA